MKQSRFTYKVIALLLVMSSVLSLSAQKERKVSFIGGARSVTSNNQLSVSDTLAADTSTAKRNTGGYALIDLGVNIRPNKSTEIMGMFRIRNGFGGFWGSGVTFDVRQLYMKGVVANALRYQLGDLNLKQTPFTLFNHHADDIDSLPHIFNLQRNIVQYEKFYMNNTWRMQGANVDFGLTFKNYIQEANFTGFLTRMNATNFSSIPDRLMGGASIDLVQSRKLRLGYNFNSVFDVRGTVRDSNVFRNNVQSIDVNYSTKVSKLPLEFSAEVGNSNYLFTEDTLAPNLRDYFAHAQLKIGVPKYHVEATIGYLNVGPEYRSIGAQSKDVNYNALPLFYDRYTNAAVTRPLSLFDVVSNDNLYNRTLSSNLMLGNNLFNNAMPYGIATFNRVGFYGRLNYAKDIKANVSYYGLSEIKGQGTLALRKFSIIKANAMVPIHKYLGMKKSLEWQVGGMLQNIGRDSKETVENVSFKHTQLNTGLRIELFKNFDFLGGVILQTTNGNDFIAERNNFTEVNFFTPQNYDVTQRLTGLGFRYNFTSKVFLSVMFQQGTFTDRLKSTADYKINQFGIIYNMLF